MISTLRNSVKWKLIASLMVIGVITTTAFMATVMFVYQNNLRDNALRTVENIQGFYQSLIENDIKMLSAALDTFTTNEAFKELYLSKNFTQLLYAGQELFESNRDRYGITHQYYIDYDGKTFLRMHKPSFSGDQIQRQTFKQAQRTNALAAGIELGKTAYALRVVKPYYLDDMQLGFIEFGEEIDHFNHIVKQQTGIDMVVLGDKTLLDENAYATSRTQTNQPNNWNDLNRYVVFSDTFEQPRYFNDRIFDAAEVQDLDGPTFLGTVAYDGRILMKGAFPLHTINDQRTGIIYLLSDVTEQTVNYRNLILSIVAIGVVTLIACFWLVVNYLQARVIDPIVELTDKAHEISTGKQLQDKITTERADEIGRLMKSFERLRVSMNMAMRELAGGTDR